MNRDLETEDFLFLHMQTIADEEIVEDNIPALITEIKQRVKDLQLSIVDGSSTEQVWRLGAYVGKYVAELCDFYENLRR